MPVLGFIGTGNMGGALARAAGKRADNELLLANRSPAKAEALAEELGGRAVSNREVLTARADRPVLVSMAAGTGIDRVRELSGGACPVIRIMPNTPCAVGEGMILYACGEALPPEAEQTYLRAMAGAGRFARIEELLIDAFADLFIEALADGGVACGLPRALAQELAAQMAVGAARLVLETGRHPGELKDAVCSPGGSTIQGVRALERAGFRAAVMDAVIAAYEKTLELGK